MNKAALLNFGPDKRQFLEQLAKSPILQSLWAKELTGNLINCNESLPIDIRTKAEVNADIAAANKSSSGIGLKVKQGYQYAKELGKFYKHGISVVWNNQKKVRLLKKNKYKLTDVVDKSGKEMEISVPSFQDLTKTMAQQVYMRSVENKAYEKLVDKLIAGKSHSPSELFSMSRNEYQLLRRTPPDFIKIPLFALLAFIFVETTPVFCYIFPEITPLTCVLPFILPRIWRPQDQKALARTAREEVENKSLDLVSMKTAFGVSPQLLKLLVLSLCLKLKYIPAVFYPESVLRHKLHSHYLYLIVDNYYLSGLNGNGNVWDLSPQEVLSACLERNLVENSKAVAKIINSGTTDEKVANLAYLRLKLVRFIADFESCNVGYLAIEPLLPKIETEKLLEWRKD